MTPSTPPPPQAPEAEWVERLHVRLFMGVNTPPRDVTAEVVAVVRAADAWSKAATWEAGTNLRLALAALRQAVEGT